MELFQLRDRIIEEVYSTRLRVQDNYPPEALYRAIMTDFEASLVGRIRRLFKSLKEELDSE